MSPLSNNTMTSPAKRPGLARRSVSSHAIVPTRTSPASATDAVDTQKPTTTAHKARAHVVGGGHRTHGRNPSFGKNLNKLQRVLQTVDSTTSIGTARHHQRKKSAPVTPAESPRSSGSHVRWEGTNTSLGEHKSHTTHMRKNYSTPTLRRNHSSALITKKSLATERPQSAKGRGKKSVGFELVADSDSDAEWEDSTQSPESTRRGSAVPSTKDSAENSQVLVDPLTFVKRPLPQTLQSRSLPPESSINSIPRAVEDSDHEGSEHERSSSFSSNEQPQAQEPEDIANRLLNNSGMTKAPPAMSSVSAMGIATAVDTTRRNESLTNLTSSHGVLRHGSFVPSSSITPQEASSSIEGGVSRFIINPQAGAHSMSRTDSDPNTPSSFLPHYHPQAPPSPDRPSSKKSKVTSPQPRPPKDGPASRTQQKLWLQRTAALITSPPDSHGSPALPQSTIDPVFIAASHSRNGQYDANRGAVNGSTRVGTTQENEAKHARKAYEKISLELHVVRRFQSPAKNSFYRLQRLSKVSSRPNTASEPASGLMGKSSKSAPSLSTVQFLNTPPNRRINATTTASEENRLAINQQQSEQQQQQKTVPKQGRVYFQDSDDVVNSSSDSADRLAAESRSADNNHSNQSDSATSSANGPVNESAAAGNSSTSSDRDGYFATEQEMLLRRMWESRGEVASPG